MKAIITEERSNARNLAGNKEIVKTKQAVVYSKGELKTPVDVRWYMGRSSNASVVYCSLWIHDKKHTSGYGIAGGYGYHKESAAMQEALASAGIKLYGSAYNTGEKENFKKECYIDGVGDTAEDNAIKAIVKALGYKGNVKII